VSNGSFVRPNFLQESLPNVKFESLINFQASGKKRNASSLLSKKRSEHQTEKCKQTQTFGRQITLQV